MGLDSGLFDSLRSHKGRGTRDEAEASMRFCCEWPGCALPASHKAPAPRKDVDAKGEPQYRRFCLEHVRIYNHSYNYFEGMSDAEVDAYQKASVTGLRPTWAMGERQGGNPHEWLRQRVQGLLRRWHNGFDGEFETNAKATPSSRKRATQVLLPADRDALETLGFVDSEEIPPCQEIKARYKSLVKRFHPDAYCEEDGDNEIDARADRLIQILRAHDHLKARAFF